MSRVLRSRMWRYLPGIETKYGIGIESFAACNPYVGASCTNLWLGYYVCVDATATGTTTTSSSATAPSPLEPSTDTKCTKWHLVVSGDTCQNIETAYDITASQFNSWNPYVGTGCASLWAGYYVCVAAPS